MLWQGRALQRTEVALDRYAVSRAAAGAAKECMRDEGELAQRAVEHEHAARSAMTT